MPTFPDFQSVKSNQTFTFSYTGTNTPEASPHSNSFTLQKTNRAQVRKESETWPLEFQLCSCWVSSVLGLQQVRSHEWKHRVNVFSGGACMRLHFKKHVIFSPALHVILAPRLYLTLFICLFLQLRLCQTAAKTNLPRCFRSSESKATAFRKLGTVVTSAPLCECHILKRLAEVVRAL